MRVMKIVNDAYVFCVMVVDQTLTHRNHVTCSPLVTMILDANQTAYLIGTL